MKIYCGSMLAVEGTGRSKVLGWKSMDEALAFKEAYEKLGYDVRMEAEFKREWMEDEDE